MWSKMSSLLLLPDTVLTKAICKPKAPTAVVTICKTTGALLSILPQCFSDWYKFMMLFRFLEKQDVSVLKERFEKETDKALIEWGQTSFEVFRHNNVRYYFTVFEVYFCDMIEQNKKDLALLMLRHYHIMISGRALLAVILQLREEDIFLEAIQKWDLLPESDDKYFGILTREVGTDHILALLQRCVPLDYVVQLGRGDVLDTCQEVFKFTDLAILQRALTGNKPLAITLFMYMRPALHISVAECFTHVKLTTLHLFSDDDSGIVRIYHMNPVMLQAILSLHSTTFGENALDQLYERSHRLHMSKQIIKCLQMIEAHPNVSEKLKGQAIDMISEQSFYNEYGQQAVH